MARLDIFEMENVLRNLDAQQSNLESKLKKAKKERNWYLVRKIEYQLKTTRVGRERVVARVSMLL